jgi:hypothetical protein
VNTTANGIHHTKKKDFLVYTSFHTACAATINFWTEPQRSALFAQGNKTIFIPRILWRGAVEGAVTVHGGVEYVRMAVAASCLRMPCW